MSRTVVHLMRHGEVHNPQGILYGRKPGFHLSTHGLAMAQRIGEVVGDRDIGQLRISPLERTRETAQPLADRLALEPVVDERVIESWSHFEGRSFSRGGRALLAPGTWRYLVNPFRPSWGEPYREIAARMWSAVEDTRDAVPGREAVIVSHQLPIWTVRLFAESRRYLHRPRSRSCTLCSLTSLVFEDERLTQVRYSEPVGDMIPLSDRSAPFSSGGAAEERRR